MYFWNLRALKRELVAGALGEGRVFSYFFAVLTFDTVLYYLGSLLPASETTIWTYVGAVVMAGTTLTGTYVAWRQNGGTAGRDFLGRYFPLLWVLCVRFLAVIMAIVLPVAFVSGMVAGWTGAPVESGDGLHPWEPLVLAVAWAWLAVFYWRLAVHTREVASAR